MEQCPNPTEELVAATAVDNGLRHAVHSVQVGDTGEQTLETPGRPGAEPLLRLAHDHPCLAFKASLVPGAGPVRVAGLGEDFEHSGHWTCLHQQGVVVHGS